ncbi:MFS transporter [Kribbella albertanoniae]|uniref:DHA2 family efflux MFS transporter permease subunit n=1 Tax=Kribbella albertanoniae TaxID=1266829 RepID=A0A4R4PL02_9ACTN|nr:MFS transporter [Kribbella albertanoniae]TDC22787.1 DHA2 family efflux MFS transporter permease subunit [Kribbella albertanoniae]
MRVSTRQRVVLAICCASIIVSLMDVSIVNVALPSIHGDLSTSVSGLQWTVDAYTLVLAVLLPLAGSTADRIGRRRVFQVGLIVFGLGSLACSLAPGIGWLIAARAVQAVGGTMLNPVAMAIVVTTFPDRRERAKAIGIFGSMSGLALALGPILGGALVDSWGWRSIFWVNLPIVVIAVICTQLFVPETRADRARRFDPIGQLLLMLTLGSLVGAIIEKVPWLLVIAALAATSLIAYERRRTEPLLELRLFRSIRFSSALVIALVAYVGFGAYLFVTTLYLQNVRDLPALAAGLSLLPIGVAILLVAPYAGRLVAARGPRVPLVIAGTAFVLSVLASFALGATTPLPVVLAIYLVFGIFVGMINPPLVNTAVSEMPTDMAGLAASIISTGRQVGISLGVALAGTVIASTALVR